MAEQKRKEREEEKKIEMYAKKKDIMDKQKKEREEQKFNHKLKINFC